MQLSLGKALRTSLSKLYTYPREAYSQEKEGQVWRLERQVCFACLRHEETHVAQDDLGKRAVKRMELNYKGVNRPC